MKVEINLIVLNFIAGRTCACVGAPYGPQHHRSESGDEEPESEGRRSRDPRCGLSGPWWSSQGPPGDGPLPVLRRGEDQVPGTIHLIDVVLSVLT